MPIKNFELFELQLTGATLAEVIESIATPDFTRTTIVREKGPIGLLGAGMALAQHGILIGTLRLQQMNGLPQAIRRNGNRRDIPIEDDEGLAQPAVFLIDPRIGVLVFESVLIGPTVGSLCELIEAYMTDVRCRANFLLTRNGYQRFLSMHYHKKIEISVQSSAVQALNAATRRTSIGQVIQNISDTGFAKFDLVIKSDTGSNFLEGTTLLRWINTLRGLDDSVTKIRVTGRENMETRPFDVDILIDRFKIRIDIPPARHQNDHYITNKGHLLLERYLELYTEIRDVVIQQRGR